MTLAQAVTEILTRSDEAFVPASTDRARRAFYVALTQTLREGNFQDYDAFGFIHEREHTFPAATNTCEISDFEVDDEVLAIRGDFFFPPEATTNDTFIIRASSEEVRKWGLSGLRPRYDRKFYQTGDTFYFYPEDQWEDVEIYAKVVTAPLPYVFPGEPNHWTDGTELTNYMTTAFENTIIEAAAQLFKLEVVVHDG